MIRLFDKYTRGKKVLILGFGREGRSIFRFIRGNFPELQIGIADRNAAIIKELSAEIHLENLHLGPSYFDSIQNYDVVIKSPGIRVPYDQRFKNGKVWLSQTALFLEQYRDQIIGITGTKGKSTTSSLIYHLLKEAGKDTILVGNIGKPPFDLLNEIKDTTKIVFELSANQLEHVHHSPHIAVLLNLFPEHLDYFGEVEKYYKAKMNIAGFQNADDILIYDNGNQNLEKLVQDINPKSKLFPLDSLKSDFGNWIAPNKIEKLFKHSGLTGQHNRKNIMAAAMAVLLSGATFDNIFSGIGTFQSLQHRLENVGQYCGIQFINDSISTIPESTIEAVKSITNVNLIILGGFDRGIEYGGLLQFLAGSQIRFFAFTGPAGRRMMTDFETLIKPGQTMRFFEKFETISVWFGKTGRGNTCLLSPAAPSYDAFKDFEERGNMYKKMAENFGSFCL